MKSPDVCHFIMLLKLAKRLTVLSKIYQLNKKLTWEGKLLLFIDFCLSENVKFEKK